jgi:hypothetical protein
LPHSLSRPPTLFNRVAEWDDLAAFIAPGGPDSLRLGVLYGRRRQGKSEILQQLCDGTGGLYTLALEQHSKPLALQAVGRIDRDAGQAARGQNRADRLGLIAVRGSHRDPARGDGDAGHRTFRIKELRAA